MDAKVEKSEAFALRIVKLFSFLKGKGEFVMSKQILKSGTSIGANIAESIFAESREDMVHKLSISLKEASETKYWLRARSLKFRGRRGRSLGVDFVTCCKEHTEVCD